MRGQRRTYRPPRQPPTLPRSGGWLPQRPAGVARASAFVGVRVGVARAGVGMLDWVRVAVAVADRSAAAGRDVWLGGVVAGGVGVWVAEGVELWTRAAAGEGDAVARAGSLISKLTAIGPATGTFVR